MNNGKRKSEIKPVERKTHQRWATYPLRPRKRTSGLKNGKIRKIMANNKEIDSLKLREYLNVPQIPFPDEPITMVRVHFCRTCVHRLRFALNEHSNKVVQCCELQPSKRSNSGYKTIKVTDRACRNYKGE